MSSILLRAIIFSPFLYSRIRLFTETNKRNISKVETSQFWALVGYNTMLIIIIMNLDHNKGKPVDFIISENLLGYIRYHIYHRENRQGNHYLQNHIFLKSSFCPTVPRFSIGSLIIKKNHQCCYVHYVSMNNYCRFYVGIAL